MKETIKKILFFFNKSEKKKLLFIFLCIILMGFVEMVGIATLLPFLAVATKPEIIQSNLYLSKIYHTLGFSDHTLFILFIGAVVFVILVAGNAFSAAVSWMTMRFSYNQGTKISTNLLKKYLAQPYVFFLNRNSSDLAKNVVVDTDRLVVGIFINSIQSLSKSVILVCIAALLFIIEPKLAISVVIVLGAAYGASYAIIRKKLAKAGKIASEVSTLRYLVIDEVMGAIKELKITGKEKEFIGDFKDSAQKYARAETINQLSPLVTRYVVEAIAFGGMILIALYLIATNEDISKLMPLLGLYALAGYRMMPAMQQLFVGLTSVKYHFSALDSLFSDMQLAEKESLNNGVDKLNFVNHLQLNNVSYNYPNSEKQAIKSVNINLPRHSTIGIVGSSGAGKTTLVDIILGLLTPSQGTLKVDEVEITENNIEGWQKNIGYVPQNIFLLDATIAKNIALGVPQEKIDQVALKSAAKLANLDQFIDELKDGYNTSVGERGVRLSGGQRQRIGIARALYHNPDLLVFDEATSALDGGTEKVIMEAIKSLSHRKSIILIAHRLNTVKDCDVIYVLNKGEVIGRGTYSELLNTNETFKHLASFSAK